MGEFIDGRSNFGRKEKRRYQAVRAVLSGLTKQVVHEPRPYHSDHFKPVVELPGVDVEMYGEVADGLAEQLVTPVVVDESTMYQRWLDHTKEWRQDVPAQPLPKMGFDRHGNFDVDL